MLAPVYGDDDYGKEHVLEIVGVADDVRHGAGDTPGPWVYVPYAQNPSWDLTLAIRTTLEPAQMVPAIRKAVAAVDPRLPVLSIKTMPQRIHDSMADDRLQVLLWTLFAAVSLGLAAIGLYGVLSFSVARRRRDIAVQMALGARGASVLRHFMAGGLRLTLAGLALGLALSWAGWRIVSSQLYVGAPLEPQATLAVAALFVLVAATACFFPARRATKVDPMEALRYE